MTAINYNQQELTALRHSFYAIMSCFFKEKIEAKFGERFFILYDFVENSSWIKNVFIYERNGDEVKLKYSYKLFDCKNTAEMNEILRTFNSDLDEILNKHLM